MPVTKFAFRWLRVATFVVGGGLLVASLVLGVGGCSAMVSQPPATTTPIRFATECSESYWPLIADWYLAANAGTLAIVTLGVAAVQHDNASNNVVPSWDQGRGQSGVMPLAVVGVVATAATVALIQSARYGKRSADACEDARLRLINGWRPPAPELR